MNAVVDGKEYELIKKGRAQADQVIDLGKWISAYGLPAASLLFDDQGNISFENGFDLISKVINVLDSDALIGLFSVIVGCSKKVSEKAFDAADLIDYTIYVYENQPSLKRVISRFFSEDSSDQDMESESSMTSE